MSRRRRTLVVAIAAAISTLSPSVATAQEGETGVAVDDKTVEVSENGSYIVVMLDDPLLASFDQDDLDSGAAEAAAVADEANQEEVLEDVGGDAGDLTQHFTNAVNGFAAQLSHDQAEALAADPRVAMVMPDTMRQPTTDSSPRFLGLTSRGGAWRTGLTGEDVVIGVIDTGIWPEHPSFADDGSYSDLGITLDETNYAACDFGNTAHHLDDAPFTCNNKLIGARQVLDTYRSLIGAEPDEFDSARDDDGHGTHTASTAGGNADVEAEIFGEDFGEVSGIAPRARIIAYKALGNLGGFTSDLMAAIDQAVADGVDVINYSIGGGPSIAGGDDIAFLFAADAGVLVATSAGNSGPGDATIGGPATIPWVTSVGANTQKRFFQGTVQLGSRHGHGYGGHSVDDDDDGDDDDLDEARHRGRRHRGRRYHGASVTLGTGLLPLVDAADAGGDLCLPGTLDPAVVDGAIVLCRRGAIGRADKSRAVDMAGGAGMILYNNDDTDNLFTDNHFVPSVHVDNTPGLAIKQYIADAATPVARIKTGYVSRWRPAPSMTIFSSRGPDPVAEDIIKPDITAPGMQILAGASPFPGPDAVGGQLFQAISGTSMSSPHIAGIYALLRQAHPDWSPAIARSAIMTTASQRVYDNDRVSRADPFAMGAGHVRPGRVNRLGSAFNPGLAYDTGFNDYLGFLCGASPGTVSEATCAALEGLGIPTDPSDMNYPSIGVGSLAGTETVTRTVTNVSDRNLRYRAHVHEPSGYDVTVTPNRISLAPGESATFEVEITNTGGGPVGEWRFGSLSWIGRGHRVRSPIAVRAAQFDAADAVSGTGADGSTSFDITFGYSGDYTAAAHGLVADAPVSATVSADPDQTYPSPDDGAGVVKHTFAVSGAAYLRWELAIPGPDDLDLFLENSAGEIVASSTNGGTDELVVLELPADDTYTMVVHGWAVPSEPLDYTLSYWEVPLASGGSLSVDSAPASAVIGTMESIDISWSGLAPGHHYGAVSHSDADGLFGLTIVDVVN